MIPRMQRYSAARRFASTENITTCFVRYFASNPPLDETTEDASKTTDNASVTNAQRVWKGVWPNQQLKQTDRQQAYEFWKERVVDNVNKDGDELPRLYKRLEARESQGGKMRQQRLGVLHADPATDMQIMCDNYTVKAIASALRDREDALQYAAMLCEEENWDDLRHFLRVYHPRYVLERRYGPKYPQEDTPAPPSPDITQSLSRNNLELIRKALMRMPRTVTQAHDKRAGVVIALCTVGGVPCILLEKRAPHLRSYPDEVALPGGMVCDVQDPSIVSTCLREMKEEIGGLPDEPVDVLGVLRCNWGDIQHLVNIAVSTHTKKSWFRSAGPILTRLLRLGHAYGMLLGRIARNITTKC